MISIRDFLVFLTEYKCLGAYWANFEQAYLVEDFNGASRVISGLFKGSPRTWLICSFIYEKTPQGFGYWDRLDNLWQMRCNYLIKIED